MKHKTGTRKQWLAARLRLLEAEKDLTRRSDDLARRRASCRGLGSTRSIHSRPTRAAPLWQTSSEGGHSSSFIISCLGLITRRGVPPAHRLRMASMAS